MQPKKRQLSKKQSTKLTKPSKRSFTKKPTAQDRAELERATLRILGLKQSIATSYYQLGRELSRVVKKQLWRAGRHANFDAYLRDGAKFKKSRARAYKFMRVARYLKEDEAVELGPEKVDLLFAYMDVSMNKLKRGEVSNVEIEIPTADGKVVKKKARDATTREIAAATKAAHAKKRAEKLDQQPGSRRAERLARLAREGLEAASINGVKVVVSPGAEVPKLSFHNVEVDNIWLTLSVLANSVEGK